MFYRDVSLPAIVEIGKNKAHDLGALLNKNHLYFEKLILFTQKELAELFHDFINEQSFYRVVIIQGGNFEEIDEVDYDECFVNVAARLDNFQSFFFVQIRFSFVLSHHLITVYGYN